VLERRGSAQRFRRAQHRSFCFAQLFRRAQHRSFCLAQLFCALRRRFFDPRSFEIVAATSKKHHAQLSSDARDRQGENAIVAVPRRRGPNNEERK
jgi:hypothetical protein